MLREWVLDLLGEFGSLWINCGNMEDRESGVVENEEDCLQLLGGWEKDIPFTCIGNDNGVSCFLFYDCGELLVVLIADRIDTAKRSGALYKGLHKTAECGGDWKIKMAEKYFWFLKKCSDCKCYNDYLITGQCTGKAEGLIIWRVSSL